MKKMFFDPAFRTFFYDVDTKTLHVENISANDSYIDAIDDLASNITIRSGSGSASVVSSNVKLSLSSGIAPGAWSNVPMVAIEHDLDCWNIDIRSRISSLTGGDNSSVYLAFGIRRGSAGNEGAFLNIRGDGGSVDFYTETIPGSGVQATAGSIARSTIASGNFWSRAAVRGAQIITWYGIGVANEEPSDWIMIGQVTNASNHRSSYLSSVVITLDAVGGGSADNVDITFTDIKIKRS